MTATTAAAAEESKGLREADAKPAARVQNPVPLTLPIAG